jgi:hypothetical protein
LCLFNKESKLNVLLKNTAVGRCYPLPAIHGHIEKLLTTFTGGSYMIFCFIFGSDENCDFGLR